MLNSMFLDTNFLKKIDTFGKYEVYSEFFLKFKNIKVFLIKVYLDKGMFEEAKEICYNNPYRMKQVLIRQAEHLFDSKQ